MNPSNNRIMGYTARGRLEIELILDQKKTGSGIAYRTTVF
jgi:hypothetical protein